MTKIPKKVVSTTRLKAIKEQTEQEILSEMESETLPKLENQNEEKSAEFSKPEKKETRGRPKKVVEEKEFEAINLFSETEITPTISFLLNTIFERKGWARLSKDETDNLGSALTKVVNKHFPKIITKYVEELQLAIIIGGIFTARLLSETKQNAKQNNFDSGQKGERENEPSKTTIEEILQSNNS